MLNHIPRIHIIAALTLTFVIVISFIIDSTPQADATPSDREVIRLSLAATNDNETTVASKQNKTETTAEEAAITPETAVVSSNVTDTITPPSPVLEKPNKLHKFTVKKGDTLSSLFARADIASSEMYQVLASDASNELSKIHPGEIISFSINPDNELSSLTLQTDILHKLVFTKSQDGRFTTESIELKPEIIPAYVEGTIQDSLFLDGAKAGLTQKQIMAFANIFGWEIDFALDLREGDRFSVLYEKRYLNGKRISDGRILVAQFSNKKRDLKAVLFEDNKGNANYFTPEGKSLRTAFLRTPIPLARVSSHFSRKRWHPVLHKMRSHKGTDYAASRGTPIRVTSDGTVIFRGWKGGYGRVVIVKHSSSITTLYAHMSRFKKNVKRGSRVKQGQTIGYVGSSGLASGPHLHYEYRVNGVQRDAEKVKFPHASPVPRSQLAAFKKQSQYLLAQYNTFHESAAIALNK